MELAGAARGASTRMEPDGRRSDKRDRAALAESSGVWAVRPKGSAGAGIALDLQRKVYTTC